MDFCQILEITVSLTIVQLSAASDGKSGSGLIDFFFPFGKFHTQAKGF